MDKDEIDPQAQLEAAQAEIARLRARVHEAVDETQRRYAKMQSELDERRSLMRWAYTYIYSNADAPRVTASLLSVTVVALLHDENQRLRKVVKAAETWRDVGREVQNHPVPRFWEVHDSLCEAVDEWRQSRGPDA